jgi:hypothetical protein
MDKSTTNTSPGEGFVVEIDGHFVSEFGSITAALNAGLALGSVTDERQLRVYDGQRHAPAMKEPPEFHWWMALADPTQGM